MANYSCLGQFGPQNENRLRHRIAVVAVVRQGVAASRRIYSEAHSEVAAAAAADSSWDL